MTGRVIAQLSDKSAERQEIVKKAKDRAFKRPRPEQRC